MVHKSLGHSTKAWSSRTYNSWRAMMARCQNPNHQKYRIYGARGIKVCPRWNEFAEFLADMGEAPEGCTLDRIDNDADYCPANCRWATQQTQQRNRRNNVRYTLNGVSEPLSTWCEMFDIPYSTAQKRLKDGATIERALTKGRLASQVQPPDGTTERAALTEAMLMLDIDGDDPLSDELGDIWLDAMHASDECMHPRLRGFSEWCGRTQAACKVLIERLPDLYRRAEANVAEPSMSTTSPSADSRTDGPMCIPPLDPVSCSQCGRKSWSDLPGAPCDFPQPSGDRCLGVLHPHRAIEGGAKP